LKDFINVFESFHKVPHDLYKKINSLIEIKGTFNIKDLINFSFNLNHKNVKQKIPLNSKEYLKIVYENPNKNNNKISELKDKEEEQKK